MSEQVLKVELREETGKGISRRLRNEGRIPGVVFGKGIEPAAVSVNLRELTDVIAGKGGRNHILTLDCEGPLNGQNVIVSDLLLDSLKGQPRTVDFHKINLSDKVKVHVPIAITGTAAGVKAGGFLDFALHQLEVECLPVHIPEAISVDVTELTIGHSIHVGDIPAPVGLTILSDPSVAVISILGRKSAEETAA